MFSCFDVYIVFRYVFPFGSVPTQQSNDFTMIDIFLPLISLGDYSLYFTAQVNGHYSPNAANNPNIIVHI